MNIKKGDNVIVISGAYKGKKGAVLSVLREANKVVVEGIAIKKVHKKKTSKKDGQIIEIPGAIDASNVSLIDPESKKKTRVKHKMINGKKIRVAKSGQEIK